MHRYHFLETDTHME